MLGSAPAHCCPLTKMSIVRKRIAEPKAVTALLSQLTLLQPATSWPSSGLYQSNFSRRVGTDGEVQCFPAALVSLAENKAEDKAPLQVPEAAQRPRTEGSQAAGALGSERTLAHPDNTIIQGLWHSTNNQGKQPADFSYASTKKVCLQCPGCRHGCGIQHEWVTMPKHLTRRGGRIVCPLCESHQRFCPCQSVAADPRLSAEWHPDNPPATQVAKASDRKYTWLCPNGHAPYKASCKHRYIHNTGCPVCGDARAAKPYHPLLSVGRPDLAEEWDIDRNDKSPDEVTLGSDYKAWWRCSNNPEHFWQATVRAGAMMGTGCPECNIRFKKRIFGSMLSFPFAESI